MLFKPTGAAATRFELVRGKFRLVMRRQIVMGPSSSSLGSFGEWGAALVTTSECSNAGQFSALLSSLHSKDPKTPQPHLLGGKQELNSSSFVYILFLSRTGFAYI